MSRKVRVIWEPAAAGDLGHLRAFIAEKNRKAAANAARKIIKAARVLMRHPHLGR